MTDSIFNKESDNPNDPENTNASVTRDSDNPQDTPTTTTNGNDTIPEVLEQWVGEGKKFKTMDDFVKGYEHSQTFVDQLKAENADMRSELEKASSVEDLVTRIEASRQKDNGDHRNTTGQDTALDEASVQKLIADQVTSEVTRRERERSASQNEQHANDKLVEAMGGSLDKAKEAVKSAANDLGVSVDYLRQQAQTSPTAFLRLVQSGSNSTSGISPSQAGASRTSVNTESLQAGNVRGRGDIQPKSHWDKLRREMNKYEFYSPRVQNAMMRSRAELGDEFYDV